MTSALTPARLVARLLPVGGWLALAGITLASPGATRMYATPWNLVYAIALLAPALALLARGWDRNDPLRRPGPGWSGAALAWGGVVVMAALVSPFPGPSLLAAAALLAPIAAFFLWVDGLLAQGISREAFWRAWLIGSLGVEVASLGLWGLHALQAGGGLAARNPYPLGHSNYTAGLSLLALPPAVVALWRQSGRERMLPALVAVHSLGMLFTSGSRGGLLGVGALALTALWYAPASRRRKVQLAALLAVAAGALVFGHPRMRATLLGGAGSHLVAASEVQRSAMSVAGWRMGLDRPMLGWGPGMVPLVYPKYRSGLPGGAENVLQLHSLPIQIWAELGFGGIAVLVAWGAFVAIGLRRSPLAASTLLGYGAFALTDWQLDVPVFGFAVAALGAVIAVDCQPARRPAPGRDRRWSAVLGCVALAGVLLVAFGGRRDPTPELNVRALALARDPARAAESVALLQESLAQNPDQEIAHFNLGWLLLVRDPAGSERHFRTAARLVPDKGGVYFGLGLACLNQRRPAAAVRALALECLNDPAFLQSPWWREPALAAVRDRAAAELAELLRRVGPAAGTRRLDPGWLGRVPDAPERVYRRERTGYPVLMRNLDLPPPQDLYDVRETTAPPPGPLPPKGWLPSPLLLALLDAPLSPNP
ncbi:MAG: O-antigen ligase family protein [Verrucomicrobia bacterium]|nr:O-antigen ligase family protein [Verrucomicrobiota bacterium]